TRTNKKEIQNQKRNTHLSTLQNEKLDTKAHKKITTPTNFTNPAYQKLFIEPLTHRLIVYLKEFEVIIYGTI
ncbi:MAG: hypothetical protein AB1604_09625, partial [Euryarchaeota archaeon]